MDRDDCITAAATPGLLNTAFPLISLCTISLTSLNKYNMEEHIQPCEEEK